MTDTCRALLLRIAAYLDRSRPTHLMWPGSRDILARMVAVEHHGLHTDLATETEREILTHAPGVTPGIRRARYAEELRRAAAED
ncbi:MULTISPECIES: hypothetical protein [unclassified Streptomyces]|uniref:hypothetical protein n=1 Tax=unclassified Streptomyces TaxID=2593676 RepID=UPI002270E489|nr:MULTISPECIES: hypothetical protein [unclassified Streptomyces]MCY0921856.1 hypothetical protein [Streptomyces sp. H27-G5]MCY0957194.1 hypothetical protein [Streptomyces sp. H27-H5]